MDKNSIIIFSNGWTDTPLEDWFSRVNEWGYHGVELATWGEHFSVEQHLANPDYTPEIHELLQNNDLHQNILAVHRLGTAVGDHLDERYQKLLPSFIWGSGKPIEVRDRAIEAMHMLIPVAKSLGVSLISGFMGSPIWHIVNGWPLASPDYIRQHLESLVELWQPILSEFQQNGLRFALEVHPGQIAFDWHSTEVILEAFSDFSCFGLTLDPSHLLWQGIDPVEFIRHFSKHIFHIHVKDVTLNLNGRQGILNGYLPATSAQRGWQFRSPGRGDIDWENLFRATREIPYDGLFSFEYGDADMDRDHAAGEAIDFIERFLFPGKGKSAKGM